MRKKRRSISFTVLIFFIINTIVFPVDNKHVFAEGEVNLLVETIVDKTSAYTGEEITYTIKYSNPNTTTAAHNVVIKDILPDNLQYISSVTSQHIENISVTKEGISDVVAFNFYDPLPAGASGIVKVVAKFPEGKTLLEKDGQPNTAVNKAEITTNNGSKVESNEVTVTPKIKSPSWTISKTRVVPSSEITPAAGQPVTYDITVKGNDVIGGLDISNLIIEDILPMGAELITNISAPDKYEQESTNEEQVTTNGKVTWNIGELKVGATVSKRITLKYPSTKFGVDISGGKLNSVTNTAKAEGTFLGESSKRNIQATNTHGFALPSYGVGAFRKDGRQTNDRYSLNQKAKFYLNNIENKSNVPIDKIVIEDNIPSELKLTDFTTGSYSSASSVIIKYKTNINNSDWISWPSGPFTSSQTLNASAISNLDEGEYITNLRWEISNGAEGLPAGFKNTASIQVNGSFKVSAADIKNTAVLTAYPQGTPEEQESNKIVRNAEKTIHVVNAMPWLRPTIAFNGTNKSYYMKDVVTYKLTLKNDSLATGDYVDPVAVASLPQVFEDIKAISFDAKGTDMALNGQPELEGNKLKWSFNGALAPGEYVELLFSAKIKDQTLVGKYPVGFYATTKDNSVVLENDASEIITDTTDIDSDEVVSDKLVKASIDTFVKFQGSINSQKLVKGELDSDYHFYDDKNVGYGRTLPGGAADYKLIVKNSGANGPISNIVVIDVLPFVGDTGLIDTKARGSEWRPYLVNKIIGKYIDKNLQEQQLPLDIKLYYSTNASPSKEELRDPENKKGQAADGWSLTPPEDITTVRSIKFDFGNFLLQPEEQIVLEWPMRTSAGAQGIAWNSFAYGATYPDVNGNEPFIPSEPLKVGFKVEVNPEDKYNLGDFVWEDLNKNGLQDEGETGINGVLVNLYDKDSGNLVKYTRTGFNKDGKAGYYQFPNLDDLDSGGSIQAGHYDIEFIFPKDYKVTAPNAGGDEALDSDLTNAVTDKDDNGTEKYSVKYEDIVVNSDNFNFDLGLYKIGSIDGKVWNDKDASGSINAGESVLSNIIVKLLDGSGNPARYGDGSLVGDAKTDSNGLYSFNNLEPGTYKVSFINPNKEYKFTAATGDSDAKNIEPDDSYGVTDVITLKSGEDVKDIDAGMYLGAISGVVWHDKNGDGLKGDSNSGINGFKVELYTVNEEEVISSSPFLTVDIAPGAGSNYSFEELKPGKYMVKFIKPSGYDKFTLTGAGKDSKADRNDGITAFIDLTAGEREINWDAGFYKLASVGDRVWNDRNANGVQDNDFKGSSEPVIADGVVSVTITGVRGYTNTKPVVNGAYSFTNLDPDTYTLTFTSTDNSYIISTANQGGDDNKDSDINNSGLVTQILNSGDNYTNVDAGFHKGYIGDLVWVDKNGNGLQGDSSSALNNVVVNLYRVGDETPYKSTTTNASGNYEFYDLDSGNYIVEFITPNGYKITEQIVGADRNLDSDADKSTGRTAVTITQGGVNKTIDCGMYVPATLGDFVWEDLDGDNVQDVGESGVNGITVELFKIGGTIPVSSTTTFNNGSIDGYYKFYNLTPGIYDVKFIIPNGVNYDAFNNAAAQSPKVYKIQNITLTSGQNDLLKDAAVYKYASIGDKVWQDTNKNGSFDIEEAGLVGVSVEALRYNGTSWISKGTAATDASGNYLIGNLQPGTYYLKFTNVSGYTFTDKDLGGNDAKDSDVTKSNGETDRNIKLTSGMTNLDYDAGVYKLASLKVRAWEDTNGDGLQSQGEAGKNGVTVKVYKDAALVATNTTLVDGTYTFTNLEPGTYSVEFVKPSSYAITSKDEGSDDSIDSDINTLAGKTDNFILEIGQDKQDVAAGFYKLSSLAGSVFEDIDGDGNKGEGEPFVSGVTVKLIDSKGQQVGVDTLTDVNGKYTFSGISYGSYTIQFSKNGHVITTKTIDNLANTDGTTDSISLATGEDKININAGLYRPITLGDYVWLDKDSNGVQDIGEPALAGITLVLIDKDGHEVNTVSDSTGKYSFKDLAPGSYKIRAVSDKAYYKLTLKHKSGAPAAADNDFDITTGLTDSIVLKSGDNITDIDAGFTVKSSVTIENTVYAGNNSGQGTGTENVIGEKATKVTYLFKVTNTGDTYLSSAQISNRDLDILNNSSLVKLSGNDILAPGESAIFYYESAISKDLTNTAEVNAVSCDDKGNAVPNVEAVKSSDTSSVDMVAPSIEVDKSVYAGRFISDKTGDTVVSGKNNEWVTYVFKVTNTGDTYLNNIEIEDTSLNKNKSEMTYISGSEPLAPGGVLMYYYESKISGDFKNIVEVSGTPCEPSGNELTNASKPSSSDSADVKALGSIGDTVWYDNNGDKQKNVGELGIEGVKIKLLHKDGTEVLDGDNKPVIAVTDSDGRYLFDRLIPGEYKVSLDVSTLPKDLYQTSEADNDKNGEVAVILIPGQEEASIDFGYYKYATIGDVVWEDKEEKGIWKDGSLGIAGVTVELYKQNNTTWDKVQTTSTDADGKYLFKDLTLGNYYIQVIKPSGYGITKQNSSDNENVDSDISSEGKSDIINITAGMDKLDVDAGLYKVVNVNVVVKNKTTGQVVSGAEVKLFTKEGVLIEIKTTNSEGSTSFERVSTNKDYVIEVTRTGYDKKNVETVVLEEDVSVLVELQRSVNYTPSIPDYTKTTKQNTPYSSKVKGTEQAEGYTLVYSKASNPSNGTVQVNSDGSWTYTPNKDFVGVDVFKIKVEDGDGGTAYSTITIKVLRTILDLIGTVTDQQTGKVIPNTTIKLLDENGKVKGSAVTDSKGDYIIKDVFIGGYRLVAENNQYTTQNIEVNVSPERPDDTFCRQDVKLVNFIISLEANPNSIIGDGKSSSLLTSTVKDKKGLPIEGVLVKFSAEAGSFPNGNTAVTDKDGKASIIYKSALIEGTDSRVIPVKAEVVDEKRGLHSEAQILITFEPGSIQGVVINNETKLPVKGAIVEIYKDFDGDGLTDFYGRYVTGEDGVYNIAIPKGNTTYEVLITKPVKIGDTEVMKTFKQISEAGVVTGVSGETFSSNKSSAGLLLFKQPDGTVKELEDYSKYDIDIYEKNGEKLTLAQGIEALIGNDAADKGIYSVDGLDKGRSYSLAITYTFEDGRKIVVGSVDVTIKEDGEINIGSALIDPYGTITSSVTGSPVSGADVKLYYANTARNKANGITPDTLVNLPILDGFEPADNKNPQQSDSIGKYAFMVFPNTDYYITVNKEGYKPYKSETISVEKELVKKDIQISPKDLVQTGSIIDYNVLLVAGLLLIAMGSLLVFRRRKI
jgi:uncharacterized repeat protein (TIGR01451 family)